MAAGQQSWRSGGNQEKRKAHDKEGGDGESARLEKSRRNARHGKRKVVDDQQGNAEEVIPDGRCHPIDGGGTEHASVPLPSLAEGLQNQTSANGDVDMAALQYLHNLVQLLNLRERDEFLRTHSLVTELDGGSTMQAQPQQRQPAEAENLEEVRPASGHASEGAGELMPEPLVAQLPLTGTLLQVPTFTNPVGVERVQISRESGQGNRYVPELNVVIDDSTRGDVQEQSGVQERERRGGRKGKACISEERTRKMSEEMEDFDERAKERERQERIKHLRRELRAAERGSTDVGGSSGQFEDGSRWRGATAEATGRGKKAKQSANALRMLERHDPLGPEWTGVRDVPPVEVNRLGEPAGAFWDHMAPFVFERGTYVFP
jgi:hypothetical protein